VLEDEVSHPSPPAFRQFRCVACCDDLDAGVRHKEMRREENARIGGLGGTRRHAHEQPIDLASSNPLEPINQ